MNDFTPLDPSVKPCPAYCPRHALPRPILVGTGWLAAIVASLYVAEIPYDAGEDFCGVWGCFPPVPPMVAMHLFWAVILAGGVYFVRAVRPALLRPLGFVACIAALVAGSVLIGPDLSLWLERVSAGDRHFWPRRVGYVVATSTDLPVVQGFMAGVAAVLLGRRA